MAPRDGDGLGMAPRPGEPESALLPGMAAPRPPEARISPPVPFGRFGHVQLGSMPDTSGPGPVALETPLLWGYDFDPATGFARAQFSGIVLINGSPVVAGGVASFNTRTGAVTLQLADVTAVGGAPLASPTFTGVPAAPTAALGTNTTQLATMAAIQAALAAPTTRGGFVSAAGAICANAIGPNSVTNYTLIAGNAGPVLNLVTGIYTPPAGRFWIQGSFGVQGPAAGNGTWTYLVMKNGVAIPGTALIMSVGTLFSSGLTLGLYVDATGTDTFNFAVTMGAAGVMSSQGNGSFSAFPI